MTMHVVYDHECPSCGAHYIPYDENVPCPRCGAVESARFDYIPQAAASMRVNKEFGGSYRPPAWWVGSLGDHILHLLFGLFDGYEAQRGTLPFEAYVSERLHLMQWGDQEYLRNHIAGIAMRVRDELGVT
jgi:hypothetical protein